VLWLDKSRVALSLMCNDETLMSNPVMNKCYTVYRWKVIPFIGLITVQKGSKSRFDGRMFCEGRKLLLLWEAIISV